MRSLQPGAEKAVRRRAAFLSQLVPPRPAAGSTPGLQAECAPLTAWRARVWPHRPAANGYSSRLPLPRPRPGSPTSHPGLGGHRRWGGVKGLGVESSPWWAGRKSGQGARPLQYARTGAVPWAWVGAGPLPAGPSENSRTSDPRSLAHPRLEPAASRSLSACFLIFSPAPDGILRFPSAQPFLTLVLILHSFSGAYFTDPHVTFS